MMKIEEALEELKSCLRCANYVDEIYVDCIPKEAVEIAIKALEEEINQSRPGIILDRHPESTPVGYNRP